MKMARSTEPARQAGISLIEAMISILLVAALGLGVTFATSRVLFTQRYAATQNLAIVQLREFLQTGHSPQVAMAGETLPIADTTAGPTSVTVTVGSVSKSVTLVSSRELAVQSTTLFSGDGRVSLSY